MRHEHHSCICCGSTPTRPWFRGLGQCTECGFVYFPHRLTLAETRRLYGEDYFNGAEYFRYLDDRAVHERNFGSRVHDLARWLPSRKWLFEIGCAYGLFLNLAREKWKVRGCDVATGPCRFAKDELRLDVECADFARLPLNPGEVDAFCLWDTIEHLDDPPRYLAKIASVLRPGGLLALTTGDIGSWLARLRGPRWRQIHPPTHLWYFDRKTIRRLLARFGFDVVDMRAAGMWRGVGQIAHGLRISEKWRRRLSLWKIEKRMIWLNSFDLMRVIALRSDRPILQERIAA